MSVYNRSINLNFIFTPLPSLAVQEPFSILPLEALCDAAISGTIDELLAFKRENAYDLPT